MKRRKHKRNKDSKPAEQVINQSELEKPANPEELQVEVESSASYIELQAEIEDISNPTELQKETEEPAGPLAPADAQEPVPGSSSPAGADRRTHPRYAFTAAVEIATTEPGPRLKTRVRDLSQQGCYVDTDKPLPLGTATEVRITKGAESLEAHARVVYNQPGRGMGLMFTTVELSHRSTLDSWIAESRETSWLAANRRRSQRVLMKIPVRLSVQAGAAALSEEETHTLAVSAHGALIAVSAPLYRGQRLTLSNVQTKGALECVVVHIDRFPGEEMKVGVEFLLPNPTFWHVAFPPKDWTPRHPDAKSRTRN
jgi:PilZ domain-containing protein